MLRRARPEDADSLAVILRSAMKGAMPHLPDLHTPDEDRWFFRAIVLPNEEVWVAEVGGRIAGFASLGTRDGADFLQHLYVAPEFQRRGIGAQLLAKAKKRRPNGFSFWVFQQNSGARRFYERHGCRLVRLTDGAGNEEREPDALYEFSPEPASAPAGAGRGSSARSRRAGSRSSPRRSR